MGVSLRRWLEPSGGPLNSAKDRDTWLGTDPLPNEPITTVDRWLREAFDDGRQSNPHAVALATIDEDGRPSVRMVLCTSIDRESGAFTIYTNRESRKGRALANDPRAAIVFHWPGRQARIEGRVIWSPDEESDAYFASRPLEARLAIWASDQSAPTDSRKDLVRALEQTRARFSADGEDAAIPRPPQWGGIKLIAESVELWGDRADRIHDRVVWSRTTADAPWATTRLQP